MPGFDITHAILLFGIALIVFGPDRLQEVARTVGHTLGEFRRAASDLPSLLSEGSASTTMDQLTDDAGESEAGTPGQMTIIDHFQELRKRIFYAALPILLTATIAFFFSDQILHLLKAPAGANFQINAFGPMDGFVIKWKIALYAGLVLASPNWLYQLLAFISPGLTPRERRFLVPTLVATAVLFVMGSIFGYVLLSGMVRVMFTMFGAEINYLPNANQYISFVVFFMVACGFVFELPAVLLVLVRFGILKVSTMKKQRKIAYFLLFAFSEIITPVADPFVAPMIVMAPLVILYEAAILASRFILPKEEPES